MTRRFFIGLVLVNLLWLLAAALLQSRVLPSPIAVYAQFGKLLQAGLPGHLCASLLRVLAGMLLSIAIGLPLGLLMSGSGRWNRLLTPLVYFSYPIPKTALLPVAMLLLGLRESSKLIIMVLTTVFQVIVAVRDSAAGLNPAMRHVAVSAGASRSVIFREITLPAILPDLFTSLRVGAGTSLAILLIVEAYGTRHGLGYFILDAWARLNYVQMYGGIAVLATLGAALFLAFDLIERRICRWKHIS